MDPNLHESLAEVQDRLHDEVLGLRLVLFWKKMNQIRYTNEMNSFQGGNK